MSVGENATMDFRDMQMIVLTKGAARIVAAPLDRIKYLMQCQGELLRQGRLIGRFHSALNCVRRTVANESFFSLYRGTAIHLVGIVPSMLGHAYVGIPVQSLIVNAFPGAHNDLASMTALQLLSGIGGAAATSIVTYPFDMLRFCRACDIQGGRHGSYLFANSLDFLTHPIMATNPHHLYRGVGLYLTGSLLYRTIYMWLLAAVMTTVPIPVETDTHAIIVKKLVAQALGNYVVVTLATLALYPLDTIRKRLMLTVNRPREFSYRSIGHCAKTVLRHEGPAGLYRGAAFTMFRGALTTTLALVIGVNF